MKENLRGHGKSYKGSFNVEPTEKQISIIQKLRAYYGKKIPYVRTRNEAWHLISKYSNVVKYDKDKNEFYIEEIVVTKTSVTLKSIESDEDIKCKEVVKRTKDVLNEEQLKAYEAFLSEIGDYNDIIIEVSEKLIEQIEDAKYWEEQERIEDMYWKQQCNDYLNRYEPGDDFEEDWIRSLE